MSLAELIENGGGVAVVLVCGAAQFISAMAVSEEKMYTLLQLAQRHENRRQSFNRRASGFPVQD